MKNLTPLPFDLAWPEIKMTLATHRNLVLVAEPGAGKTTRLPAMLIDSEIVNTKSQVSVLEPRRLAARAAATRISYEREWPMKSKVGYSVRFDHQIVESTRLAFFTEGLFLKKLASNPTLIGIDCVVLDEFHERSRYTDLAIAALKELQLLERPDLRVVVMSATIDAERIANYLAIDAAPAPIVNVPGRTFPVEVRYSSEPLSLQTSREWIERISRHIKSVAIGPNDRLGDILVFLPGVGEIRRMLEILTTDLSLARQFQILELHGSLSLEQQSQVLTPNADDTRPRIILATNIAETSLTIDGVGTVIDTGLARVARADKLGFSQLHLERISMASAKQRTGRAGRQAPGLCYRMWSKLDENSFQDFDEAELNRIDLADSLLTLYSLGVSDPRNFDWFERPDSNRLEQSLQLLSDLGAIDSSMRLTDLGHQMNSSGLPARAARMMVAATRGEIPNIERPEAETLAAIISALLTEKDFILDSRNATDSAHECDLYARAIMLNERASGPVDRIARKTVRRVIDSYLKPSSASIETTIQNWNEKAVAAILLKGFPDRVARRRRAKSAPARMVGGKGIELHPSSSVRESELFFALKGDAGTSRNSNDPMTTMASALQRNWLEAFAPSQCSKKTAAIFDEENLSAYGERVLMYRDLPLEAGTRDRLDPNDAFEILKEEALARRDLFMKAPPIANLAKRVASLVRQKENASLISEATVEEEFRAALEQSLFGQSSLKAILSDEGAESFASTWERRLANQSPRLSQMLRDHAPSHFEAPTGNRFRIEYPENQPPFVEVRLQELFGTATHPHVAGQPLTFHLLGPNFRPVQVTADLPGFWKGSYFEVRKELRARYPKHSWPENPLEAPPEAKGRRHIKK